MSMPNEEKSESTEQVNSQINISTSPANDSEGSTTEVTNTTEKARSDTTIYRPELEEIAGYINVDNLLLNHLQGKVILIDFWTYTCINCIRTFPYLKDWHEKYADDGLVIVGVHTPEFEFEEILENVENAVREFGIEYPVVLDNERATWGAYKNQYWPAKYLIDREGYIRYSHFGEGAYKETELVIRDLLIENGNSIAESGNNFLKERPYVEIPSNHTESESQTRELYAGTIRNYNTMFIGRQPPYVAHEQFYVQRDEDMDYKDPGSHRNHFMYFNGRWLNKSESLKHSRETKAYEDYVALLFYGTSANVVLSGFMEEKTYKVMIYLDELPVKSEFAGEDIMWDSSGNSYIDVSGSRLYRLIKSPRFDGFELKLSSNSEHFELFAFTFGSFQN